MTTAAWLEQALRGEGDATGAALGPGELTALIEAADEHGVAALLWASRASAQVHAALDGRVRAAATRDLLVQGEMRRVLETIAAAGGRALVFKGSALAYTVYDQPWHRPRTDVDLLTSRPEVERASQALESCGYRRSDALSTGELVSHQVAFERADAYGLRHIVDLHWKVVNPQALADVVPFEEAWAAAELAPALGPAAHVPSRVHSVLLACVHRLAHHQGHDRLIWLYDLTRLVSPFDEADWRHLADLAVARGVAAICHDGLARAHDALGGALPDAVRARLDEAGRHEATRRYVIGTVHKRDVLRSDLEALPDWRARARLLREHAFPPAAFVMQRYGARHRWLLPFLYARRLVTGAFKWARP